MFTQKISMDCTREQYEKYLKDELLRMGYNCKDDAHLAGDEIIVNNGAGLNGTIIAMLEGGKDIYGRTYLGSFNAPLFLALAAMTDKVDGGYREYYVKDDEFYSMKENGFLGANGFFRKATKEKIMAKFGKKKSNHNTPENIKEVADRLCNDINKLKGAMIHEYIDQVFNRSTDESDAINVLKSKGYKILKPKTWEEV